MDAWEAHRREILKEAVRSVASSKHFNISVKDGKVIFQKKEKEHRPITDRFEILYLEYGKKSRIWKSRCSRNS